MFKKLNFNIFKIFNYIIIFTKDFEKIRYKFIFENNYDLKFLEIQYINIILRKNYGMKI